MRVYSGYRNYVPERLAGIYDAHQLDDYHDDDSVANTCASHAGYCDCCTAVYGLYHGWGQLIDHRANHRHGRGACFVCEQYCGERASQGSEAASAVLFD